MLLFDHLKLNSKTQRSFLHEPRYDTNKIDHKRSAKYRHTKFNLLGLILSIGLLEYLKNRDKDEHMFVSWQVGNIVIPSRAFLHIPKGCSSIVCPDTTMMTMRIPKGIADIARLGLKWEKHVRVFRTHESTRRRTFVWDGDSAFLGIS